MKRLEQQQQLEKRVRASTKERLSQLLTELSEDDPVLGDWLLRRLSELDGKKVAASAVAPVDSPARITRADFASIQRGFGSLLTSGRLESLLAMAPDLLALATAAAERSPGGRALTEQTARCMRPAFQALQTVDWPQSSKLIWYWNLMLVDQHSLLDELPAPIDEALLPGQVWREAAEYFQIRLGEVLQAGVDKRYRSREFARGELIEKIVSALTMDGEVDAATEVLMAELPHSQCYSTLVYHLADHGQEAAAESWARQGISALSGQNPQQALLLLDYLRSLARRAGDRLLVAAFHAEAFLLQPSLNHWKALMQSIDDEQVREVVQLQLLAWLEFSEDPKDPSNWPLSPTGLEVRVANNTPEQREERLQLLVDILLLEGEFDYAWQCFQRMAWDDDTAQRLADAAVTEHPEITREVLQQRIERLIEKVRVSYYQQAAAELRKLQTLCFRHYWRPEFDDFVHGLRKRHAAKLRLIEILDEIESSPPTMLKLVKYSGH